MARTIARACCRFDTEKRLRLGQATATAEHADRLGLPIGLLPRLALCRPLGHKLVLPVDTADRPQPAVRAKNADVADRPAGAVKGGEEFVVAQVRTNPSSPGPDSCTMLAKAQTAPSDQPDHCVVQLKNPEDTMRSFLNWVGASAVLMLAVLLSVARGAEEERPLDKLPKAVLDAVKAKFPKAELTAGAEETEDGKTLYEVSFKYKGANYDVMVTPEGKITLIEKAIATRDLPKAVATTLAAKYPRATIKLAEELSDGNDKVLAYELRLVTVEKKQVEVKFDPQGKVVNEEAVPAP